MHLWGTVAGVAITWTIAAAEHLDGPRLAGLAVSGALLVIVQVIAKGA